MKHNTIACIGTDIKIHASNNRNCNLFIGNFV